jgi:hypothetical protein
MAFSTSVCGRIENAALRFLLLACCPASYGKTVKLAKPLIMCKKAKYLRAEMQPLRTKMPPSLKLHFGEHFGVD